MANNKKNNKNKNKYDNNSKKSVWKSVSPYAIKWLCICFISAETTETWWMLRWVTVSSYLVCTYIVCIFSSMCLGTVVQNLKSIKAAN